MNTALVERLNEALEGRYVIERNAELSPNGRWMAYTSNESGEPQIYVRPFPDVESDQILVSNAGGDYPLWSRDGRELFYMQPVGGQQLVSVAVDTGGTDGPFAFGAREVLMDWPYLANAQGRGYDVSLDGQRFLAVKPEGETGAGGSSEVYIVTNWFEELVERMGN